MPSDRRRRRKRRGGPIEGPLPKYWLEVWDEDGHEILVDGPFRTEGYAHRKIGWWIELGPDAQLPEGLTYEITLQT